jgi:cytochrome oxidase Cu insertion factor (SCO1/SenC/PrrC family)
MARKLEIGLLALLILALAAGCAPTAETPAKAPEPVTKSESTSSEETTAKSESEIEELSATVAVGLPAPDFKVKDESGKEWTLASYKGKAVLLDFWGFW